MSRELTVVLAIFNSCRDLRAKALPSVNVGAMMANLNPVHRQAFSYDHATPVLDALRFWLRPHGTDAPVETCNDRHTNRDDRISDLLSAREPQNPKQYMDEKAEIPSRPKRTHS